MSDKQRKSEHLTRRDFLRMVGGAGIAAFIVACGAQPTPEVKTVEKEVTKVVEKVVEKPVAQTVVVEKVVEKNVIVTPTRAPVPLHKQGDPVRISIGVTHGPNFNPIIGYLKWADKLMLHPLLPALIWFDDFYHLIPSLAERFEINPDATNVTFYLPGKAAWSDGTPLTAQDVAFTYEMALHPKLATRWQPAFNGIKGAKDFIAGKATQIAGINVIDDHTIRFELEAPDVTFVRRMEVGILPKHILGKVAVEEIPKHPYINAPTVSSGPFEFVRWERDQFYELKRKENYWGKPAKIDRLIGLNLNGPSLTMLEAGELDIILLSEPSEVPRLKQQRSDYIDVLPVPAQSMAQYFFNLRRKPFDDARVRQAIAYAIDRKAIRDGAYGGQGDFVTGPFLGPDWAVPSDLKSYPRDPQKAKALLSEASWDANREVIILVLSGIEPWIKQAQIMQQQLEAVGMKSSIKLVTGANRLAMEQAGEWDIDISFGGGDPAEPGTFLLGMTCDSLSVKTTGYCNPKLDELAQRGIRTSVREERQKIYQEANRILQEDLPVDYLFTNVFYVAVNKGIGGVKGSATYGYSTWNITDWYIK